MATILAVCAMALFVLSAAIDWRDRRIPNPLTVALAVIGALRLATVVGDGTGVPAILADLLAMAAVFSVAAVGFRFGLLGGGDVKLLAAGTLWVGAAALAPFLLTTILAGGALALLYIVASFLRPNTGRGLPYGVAIAAGGVLTTLAG